MNCENKKKDNVIYLYFVYALNVHQYEASTEL